MTVDGLLLDRLRPYTLCTEERLKTLAALSQYLNSETIKGDFVECGTYKGGSAAILSTYLNQSRHLWLYDSFEGMPDTTTRDGADAKLWVGKCVASVEDVHEAMRLVSTERASYTVKQGWFDQTFRENLPERVALLHCDADWYDSVLLVLETFYPLIPDGGCVVLDDFGYWEGCREAFYDFCSKHHEKPLLERIGGEQAFWIKGRSHNRTSIASLMTTDWTTINHLKQQLQHAETQLSQLQAQIQELHPESDLVGFNKFSLQAAWLKLKKQIGLGTG